MQIQSVNNQNPSFGILKSVTVEGRYFKKKNPAAAKEILETLKANEKFQKFCEKYNASVILRSRDSDSNKVAALAILYRNLPDAKSKLGAWFSNLVNSLRNPGKIVREGWAWDYKDAVTKLKEHLNDKDLYYSLDYACDTADKEAKEKAEKLEQKRAAKQAKIDARKQLKTDKQNLANQIKTMTQN